MTCCKKSSIGIVAPLLLAVIMGLSACGKKEDPAPSAAPERPSAGVSVQEQPPAPPPPTPDGTEAPAAPVEEKVEDGMPTAPEDAALKYPVSKEMTDAIHLYVLDNRKMPASFQVLLNDRYVQSIKPPPGKKFALDRKRQRVVIMD